jgi:excisionase family DNA binding protein
MVVPRLRQNRSRRRNEEPVKPRTAPDLVRVDAGVLLQGRLLEVARYAVETTQRHRLRNAYPVLPSLEFLAQALTAVTAAGHTDSDQQPEGEADYMTSDEAAQVLGWSPRTVRRHAAKLGGHKSGGVWLVDRQAVLEHTEGVTAA